MTHLAFCLELILGAVAARTHTHLEYLSYLIFFIYFKGILKRIFVTFTISKQIILLLKP